MIQSAICRFVHRTASNKKSSRPVGRLVCARWWLPSAQRIKTPSQQRLRVGARWTGRRLSYVNFASENSKLVCIISDSPGLSNRDKIWTLENSCLTLQRLRNASPSMRFWADESTLSPKPAPKPLQGYLNLQVKGSDASEPSK